MSAHRAALLEERLQLLELEAEAQRVALFATLATLEERRVLAWGSSLATLAARLLAIPRIRWLLLASLLARLRPGRRR